MTVLAELSRTDYPIEINVDQAGGVNGLTVVAAIRDPVTANSWLDFSDNTFKTVGWTTRQATLTNFDATNAPGSYRLTGGVNISAWTGLSASADHFIVEYDISGAVTRNFIEKVPLGTNFSNIAAPGDAMDLVASAVDAVWDENIVSAHGTADTSGLLLRALGAIISQRSNNPNLDAILGVPDAASQDVPSAVDTQLSSSHGTGSWQDLEDRTHLSVAYDDTNQIITASFWLERNGVITTPINSLGSVIWYNPDGTILFQNTSPLGPDANGVLRFSQSSVILIDNTAYYADVAVEDATGTLTTRIGVPFQA
ncbi:MAG: hypothetical protein MJA83_13890 [Gammaproteobacteria bacterium]|nr:hypothetical protein [Gammaproteobacteria bacterium]